MQGPENSMKQINRPDVIISKFDCQAGRQLTAKKPNQIDLDWQETPIKA